MEHVRAVCARTRDTVARNAKFNGSVERLFEVERRLEGNALAALDASTLADLGEAAERALDALDGWRAASVTNRMKGRDADVEHTLAELCARGAEVAAEAKRAPRGETSDVVVPPIPAVPERDAVAFTSSSTDPPPFPPTIPTPMRRHSPAAETAAAARPTAEAVPEIRRGGAAPSAAAAADANAAYTAALEAEASGHAHVALERLCEAAELGHAAAATRAATALMTSEGTGRLRAPDDSRRAARYLRVAVAAGDADAMNALGAMLLHGDEKATGEARDLEAAARLFAEAGARGCAAADYNLAACLEAGAGVAEDAGRAKSLFRRALSLGVFRAHLPLGRLALRHDADLGAAARHFSAVSGDVPGDVSAERLETLGIGEEDVAEATFCLADATERAADVGLARLERRRASGMVPVDEKRLEALREDAGEPGRTASSRNERACSNEASASDLCLHGDADDAAARRDATRRSSSWRRPRRRRTRTPPGTWCGASRTRGNARARSCAAPPSSGTGAPRSESACRCGARPPRSGVVKNPSRRARRRRRGSRAAPPRAAAPRTPGSATRRSSARVAWTAFPTARLHARCTRAPRGLVTRRVRGAWRRWRKRRGARRRRRGGSASTRRRRRKRGGGACRRSGSTKQSRAGRWRKRLRGRDAAVRVDA